MKSSPARKTVVAVFIIVLALFLFVYSAGWGGHVFSRVLEVVGVARPAAGGPRFFIDRCDRISDALGRMHCLAVYAIAAGDETLCRERVASSEWCTRIIEEKRRSASMILSRDDRDAIRVYDPLSLIWDCGIPDNQYVFASSCRDSRNAFIGNTSCTSVACIQERAEHDGVFVSQEGGGGYRGFRQFTLVPYSFGLDTSGRFYALFNAEQLHSLRGRIHTIKITTLNSRGIATCNRSFTSLNGGLPGGYWLPSEGTLEHINFIESGGCVGENLSSVGDEYALRLVVVTTTSSLAGPAVGIHTGTLYGHYLPPIQ